MSQVFNQVNLFEFVDTISVQTKIQLKWKNNFIEKAGKVHGNKYIEKWGCEINHSPIFSYFFKTILSAKSSIVNMLFPFFILPEMILFINASSVFMALPNKSFSFIELLSNISFVVLRFKSHLRKENPKSSNTGIDNQVMFEYFLHGYT